MAEEEHRGGAYVAGTPRAYIYADNAATTHMASQAVKAYVKAASAMLGNPSSTHKPGKAARDYLDWSRKVFASFMSADPTQIVFTASGTESNTIAIRATWARMKRTTGRTAIVTTSIEHSSVKKTAEAVAGKNDHILIPVDDKGYVDEEAYRRILRSNSKRIAMISIMLANNETGTVQRISRLSQIARELLGPEIPFHTDATQAMGKYVLSPAALGVDMMTGSAHKFHGPLGCGILYVREPKDIVETTPMTGGGQERGIRSGTENVPAIYAAAVALRRMLADPAATKERRARVAGMRDAIAGYLLKHIPGSSVNGDPAKGLYNLLSISIPGVKGTDLTKYLDSQFGIAMGNGSACNKGKPSETLLAMGKDPERVRGTVRISLSDRNIPGTDDKAIASAIIAYWRASRQTHK
jgi:cysteine desulfurase